MDDKGNMVKLVAAVLVILAAVGFTFHRSRAAMPGAVANNGQIDEMEMPSSDDMHKNMKMAALAADLSTTQVEKLEQLVDEGIKEMEKMRAEWDENTTGPRRGGGGGPRGGAPGMPGGGFRGGMGGIGRVIMEGQQMMTQDQQQKFREAMQSQGGRAKRDAKTKAALSEAEYARYQEKRQELRGRFGGGGRGGGGRGGQTQSQPSQQTGGTPGR